MAAMCLWAVACVDSADEAPTQSPDVEVPAPVDASPMAADAGLAAVDGGSASGLVDAGIIPDAMAAPDMGPPQPDDVHCFDDPLEVTAEGGGFEVVGPHYRLYAEHDRARAEDAGRMLEAGWFAFDDHFGAQPQLAPDERLRVKLYADRERWVAGLAADGIDAPGGHAGGYFDPGGGTAYLFGQPTVYYTDGLTLHEAAHQFHGRGRAGQNSLPMWYVEGVVEFLARHDWDGRCLRLGVRPLLSQEDFPRRALEHIDANGLDLTAIVDGQINPNRPVAWALYAFLQTGLDGALAEGFQALQEALDGGEMNTLLALFEREVGDPADFEGPLVEWLREAQLPMRPVHLEWTHLRHDAIRGHGANFSFALFKSPLDGLTVEVTPASETWGVGLIIEYIDRDNFTGVILFDGGGVSTFEAIDGRNTWWAQGEVALPGTVSRLPVALGRDLPGQATVTFADTVFTFETTMPPILGLVINDADVRFENLRWTPAD